MMSEETSEYPRSLNILFGTFKCYEYAGTYHACLFIENIRVYC